MKKLMVSLVALALFLPVVAFAADYRTGSVSTNEHVKNLYQSGKTITTDANVSGDLVVAGGDVTVNGNVENNLSAAAGTLNVNGNVGHNARVAGATVNYNGNVGDDLLVFGGTVIINEKSVVNGDLIVAAGMLDLRGTVNGNVRMLGAGTLNLYGTVKGSIDGNVGALSVKSGAKVGGDINYTSQSSADISKDATVSGTVRYTQAKETSRASIFGSLFFGILAALVMTLFFVLLFPKSTNEVTQAAFVKPLMNFLIGFAFLFLAPIALIIVAITVLGLKLAFFLGSIYFVAVSVAGAVTAVVVGSWTWKAFRKEKNYPFDWKVATLGVAITSVLMLIPILGWLAVFVAFLITLGALLNQSWKFVQGQKA